MTKTEAEILSDFLSKECWRGPLRILFDRYTETATRYSSGKNNDLYSVSEFWRSYADAIDGEKK